MDLAQIGDRLDIDDLLTAYAVAVDGRDWDGLKALFAEGAVLDYSAFDGPRGDVDTAVAWVAEGLAGFPVSQHVCANREIAVTGDSGTARCAVINPLVDGKGKVFMVGGSYEDTLVRTPAGWRFAERVARATWSDFGAPGRF
ncbi:MAG: nuclear transport factor 2 family protein [Actinobacteria bacterium]|nr:nuclear transport factor 2 family protein [Actinomycetota bacterium]